MSQEAVKESIGERVRRLRLEKKMTQQQLADIKTLCVQRNLVNYWENDERDINIHHLIALAEFFETDCHYILTGHPAKNATLSREYGGLSNEALDFLKALHSKPQPENYPDGYFKRTRTDVINILFKDKEIFDLIHAFLNFNPERYKLLGDNSTLSVCQLDDTGMPIRAMVTGYSPEDLSFALFAKIQQGLIRIRDDMNKAKDKESKSKGE